MNSLRSVAGLLLGYAAVASAAFGPPAPLDIANIGNNVTVTVGIVQAPYSSGSYGNMGYGAGPSGGEFLGTVAGSPNYTGFWCIDDQLLFSPGSSGKANITLLAPGIDGDPDVRYSNVTNAGSPKWTNTNVNTTNHSYTLSGSATVRYEMSAWLVSQYNGFDTTIVGGTTAQKNVANAIQKAIWAITNNSTFSGGLSAIGLADTAQSDVGYWVYKAYEASTNGWNNYRGIAGQYLDPTKWAVVSWGLNSLGNLDTAHAKQTFLVEVVPEPGFYGVLAIALSGLAFLIDRKRKALGRTTTTQVSD